MVQNQNIPTNPGLSSEAAISPAQSSTAMEVCQEGSVFLQGSSPSSSQVSDSLTGVSTSSVDELKLDNMLVESSLNLTDSLRVGKLDNCPEIRIQEDTGSSQPTIDNLAYQYLVENEYPTEVKPRVRNDSTESVDTLSSASSCEIFNSEYTDTVSSTTSSVYLIKTATDSDVDTAYVSEALSNDGYMSYSSTEMLNDDDEDKKEVPVPVLVEIESEQELEAEPMLQNHDLDLIINNVESNNEQNMNDFVHHPLSPIHENEVLIFVEEEEEEEKEIVEPTTYTKITDNIVVVDESFLFNSVTNLGDLELGNKGGKRALTMNNLHERSSFLDLTEVSKVGRICQKALIYLKDDMTLGSLASLNTINAKESAKDPTQSLSLISGSKSEPVLKKSNYMKNLIALSVSITLLYIAIGSVRNLQSSINHEGGVGVIGLAVNFVGYVIGSMFSSFIVQRFKPRKCIIANLFPNLLYIAANLYPAMWVMVPISLIQGISLAVVSNAVSTYITFLAKGCAENAKGVKNFAQISGKFFGIYCLIYQSHIIVGNLIASFILEPPGESPDPKPLAVLMNNTAGFWSNLTSEVQGSGNLSLSPDNLVAAESSHLQLCGAGFCQHFEIGGSRFSVEIETKMLLFGVYIGCIILAVVNAIFILEPLNKNLFKSTVSPMQSFKSQMSSLLSFFGNVKFLLLLPLLMYSAMQFAFVSAEFMKGYVTCPLGIHMIGYTMICFGICSSASSYVCGLLNKQVGRIPFVVTAVVLHMGCLVYMCLWQPSLDSLLPYFVVMGVWGIGDGFWNTQISSLMGVIFPAKYEEAYAGLRITQGLSVAIAFGYSSALCMTLKIYITMAVCVLGLVGYLVMEAKHKREQTTDNSVKLKITSV